MTACAGDALCAILVYTGLVYLVRKCVFCGGQPVQALAAVHEENVCLYKVEARKSELHVLSVCNGPVSGMAVPYYIS